MAKSDKKYIVKDQIIGSRTAGWLLLPIFGYRVRYVNNYEIHGPIAIDFYENRKICAKLYGYNFNEYNKLDWQNQIKNL